MTKSSFSVLLCLLALMGCGAAGAPVAPNVALEAAARAGVVVK